MATPIPENRAIFGIDDVVRATRGSLVRGAPALDALVGVTSDSRAVRPGAIFVALKGETHDGHAFTAAAGRHGAGLIVVERGRAKDVTDPSTLDVALLEVDDTLVAWGDLARHHLEKWRSGTSDKRVIAITGSAGKTTTKELTAALLGAIGPTHYTAGNLNNRIGVPAVIFALEARHRFCVLEMGMSLPGELDAITSFARPDVSIVTNVGLAHAEGVGGREGVMREKGAVYRALEEGGVAVVNADDEYVQNASKALKPGTSSVTFGLSAVADYQLQRREGSLVVIRTPSHVAAITTTVPGEAAAVDLCAALAAQERATRQALSDDVIDAALRTVNLPGRAQLAMLGNDVILLDDTYNANPASMRAALATLAEVGKGRRLVAVLGEMKELGAHAEAEHAALGDAVAEAGISLVIGCGGLADRTLEAARARGIEAIAAVSTPAAADGAKARIKAGGAVLVKGSRGVRAEAVVAALQEAWPNPRKSASSKLE